MGFVDAVRTGFSKYATFSGRASRPEYWYFALFGMLAALVAAIPDAVLAGPMADVGPVGLLVSLVLLLPSIAVGVRRLHDSGRSGWWVLIILVPLVGAVVLIVFFLLPTSPETGGSDRFGS